MAIHNKITFFRNRKYITQEYIENDVWTKSKLFGISFHIHSLNDYKPHFIDISINQFSSSDWHVLTIVMLFIKLRHYIPVEDSLP